jgi:hypothetical protein
VSAQFAAKFTSRCANGDTINPGDTVHYDDDQLIHVTCDATPPDPQAPGRNERNCPDCHLIHAGGCDW